MSNKNIICYIPIDYSKLIVNKYVVPIIISLVSVLPQISPAQTKQDLELLQIEQLYFSEINPIHPIGIFSQNTPFYFKGNKPDISQFSYAYSVGNIWLPQSKMYYPLNLTELQSYEVSQKGINERPYYFENQNIQTKIKTFEADGILQSAKLSYLREWRTSNTFIVNFNLNILTEGNSPLLYLASDGFIENIHSTLFVDNNFGRKQFPYNKAFIDYTDENGNSFSIKKNKIFLSTINLHYYRQIWNYEDKKKWIEWKFGTHLSTPANSIHCYLIPGISSGLRAEFHINKKTSIGSAVEIGLSDQTFLKLSESINAIDWKYRKSAKLYLGYSYYSSKRINYNIGIINNYQDQLLSGSYFTKDQTGYHQIGISFLKAGDFWQGELLQQSFRHAKLTAASLYFFSIKTYMIIGIQKKQHKLSMVIGEDLISVNNAPDIQYGLQYSLTLPK